MAGIRKKDITPSKPSTRKATSSTKYTDSLGRPITKAQYEAQQRAAKKRMEANAKRKRS